jgi:hypothetical protein
MSCSRVSIVKVVVKTYTRSGFEGAAGCSLTAAVWGAPPLVP